MFQEDNKIKLKCIKILQKNEIEKNELIKTWLSGQMDHILISNLTHQRSKHLPHAVLCQTNLLLSSINAACLN